MLRQISNAEDSWYGKY